MLLLLVPCFAGAATTAIEAEANPTASLVRGLARSMADAARFLVEPGQRLSATRSLDNARRISRVVRDSASDDYRPIAEQAYATVRQARHALQNGRPERAVDLLRSESERLMRSDLPTMAVNELGTNRMTISGQRVINARGEQVGKVAGVENHPDGHAYAVLKVGGLWNVFGFLDIGNREIAVPANNLIAGRQMVALASDMDAKQLAARSASGVHL